MLELRNVTKKVAGSDHIRDVSLTLRHGSLNVLLGPTLSGKTSLMRLMAGLDQPSSRSSRGEGPAGDEEQSRRWKGGGFCRLPLHRRELSCSSS